MARNAQGLTYEEAQERARLNNQRAEQNVDGSWKFVPLTGEDLLLNELSKGSAPTPAPVLPTAADALAPLEDAVNNPPKPRAPAVPVSVQIPTGMAIGGTSSALAGRRPTSVTGAYQPPAIDTTGIDLERLRTQLGGGTGTNAPTGPKVDRTKIDPLLGGLNTYANDIYALSKDNTGLSVAEAQLAKATELANMNAAVQTEASQRSALGAARSVRSRGDRALAERQAIGESAFIGQEAARTDAMRQAAATGDLAILRATEADADRRFRLDALKSASDLGLNTAALEVDIGKADLASVTNFLNNQFDQLAQQGQLDLGYAQIDQQKAASLLGFTRDMAAIQFQYDQLSVTDQQEADKLLMQKYNIDQTTMVALKKIKEENKFGWDTLLTSVVGGAVAGFSGGAGKAIFDGAGSAVAAAAT